MDGCGLVWRLDFRVPLFLPLSLPGVLGFDGVEKSRCASAKKYRSSRMGDSSQRNRRQATRRQRRRQGGRLRRPGEEEEVKPVRRSVRPSSTTTTRQRALEFFRLNERRSESRRAVHESCPAAAREERGGGVVPWRRDGIGEISLPTANASQFGSGNGADGVEAEPVEQKLQCETSVG